MTTIIDSIMPINGLAAGFAVPALMQKWDRHFTNDVYVTRQHSMSKYKSIYGGEDYLIHLKFSECINKVFVAMMYGLTIPLLFPVTAINLAFTCFCERILICW